MSAQVTSEQLNQLLSFGSLAAVIAGVPPEVALGALAGAVIFVTSAVEYPILAGCSCRCSAFFAAFSFTNQQHQFLSA